MFHVMYSAYKLNKQGDNTQPCTTFLILSQSIVSCLVLTVASWPAYRFLRKQVRVSGTPCCGDFPRLIVIHTVKGFPVVNEAEDVGNLISSYSAFSKPSLDIWRFLFHTLLKPNLKDF